MLKFSTSQHQYGVRKLGHQLEIEYERMLQEEALIAQWDATLLFKRLACLLGAKIKKASLDSEHHTVVMTFDKDLTPTERSNVFFVLSLCEHVQVIQDRLNRADLLVLMFCRSASSSLNDCLNYLCSEKA